MVRTFVLIGGFVFDVVVVAVVTSSTVPFLITAASVLTSVSGASLSLSVLACSASWFTTSLSVTVLLFQSPRLEKDSSSCLVTTDCPFLCSLHELLLSLLASLDSAEWVMI